MMSSIILLGIALFGSVAEAAWPDPSEGRIYAVDLFRKDIRTPGAGLVGEDRVAEYKKACKLKYYPACNYKTWTDEEGRSDLQAAGDFFGKRCKSEPLSCVVSGWAKGYVNGKPSNDALNPKKAFKDLTHGCKKKAYGPACAHLGEMYLAGVGTEKDPAKAQALFQEACKARDKYGCYIEGDLYFQGLGVDQDFKVALERYEEGCSNGYTQACLKLGTMYEQGKGTTQDYKKALDYFTQACDKKYIDACVQVATMYAFGKGIEQDIEKAIGFYKPACDQDHPEACSQYGAILVSKEEYTDAATYVKKGCDEGVSFGCFQLANLYYNGQGVDRDLNEAIQYYDKSCSKEIPEACFSLATMYENGEGTEEKFDLAFSLYDNLCQEKEQEACFKQAKFYQTGKGVEQNIEEATRLYKEVCTARSGPACSQYGIILVSKEEYTDAATYVKKGCDSGDLEGCVALGTLYYKGKGVSQDYPKAKDIFVDACAKEVGIGCSRLGTMYEQGFGVRKDADKSLEFFQKGCQFEDGVSCRNIGISYKNGTNGFTKSTKDAVEHFDQGCNYGDQQSCQEMADYYYRGEFVQQDIKRAYKLYKTSCALNEPKGCKIVADLIVEGVDGNPPNYANALAMYEKSCELGMKEACTAQEPILFPGRYEQIIERAFDSEKCEVWTYNKLDKKKETLVLSVNQAQFTVLEGQYKGQEFTAKHKDTSYQSEAKLKVAQSNWDVVSEKTSLTIDQHEDWYTERMSVYDFPWTESASKDSTGKESIYYSRTTETMRRNIGKQCQFINKEKYLKADNCSEVQALIGAQLLSTCK